MNNDYSFINSSDTSEQLALLDEFLSENYEFRHNVLSDVYEIRELGSEPKPFRPFTREARNSLLRRIKSWDDSIIKRMAVLWQIMAGEISSAIIYIIELQCFNGNLWQMADFSLFSSDSSYKTHFVGGLHHKISIFCKSSEDLFVGTSTLKVVYK